MLSEDVPLFQGKQFAKVSSLQDLVLKIIYSSIFHFVEHLKVINAVSDALEEQINTSMQNKYLLNLFSLEKSLVYYLNAINSNGKLIERLKTQRRQARASRAENVEFIDDMIIENSQCYEQAEIYSNILASMMDARVSIVSNNLNWLMKTLTIITIAIMLPTLVVSIFSMNVRVSGQGPSAGVLDASWRWRWRRWSWCGSCGGGRNGEQLGNAQGDRSESGRACTPGRAWRWSRPCARSKSKVEIRTPRQTVDAGDILQLLGLGAAQGTELVLSATGPDAEEVLDRLADLFANRFGLCGEPD